MTRLTIATIAITLWLAGSASAQQEQVLYYHTDAIGSVRMITDANGQPVPVDSEWVWWDIQRIAVLNGRVAKEAEDEKHICPLQLDLIERCITRWSNPDDIVLDPFAGIGSVPWQALRMGRRGLGIELKRSYFELARRFLDDLELQQAQPNFLHLLDEVAA